MKKILYILVLMNVIPLNICSQDYYWYKGEKIPLQRGDQRYILYQEKNANVVNDLPIIQNGNISYSDRVDIKWGIVAQSTPIATNGVLYQTPSFLCNNSIKNIYVTHRFYVKLRDSDDFALLQDFLKRYNAEIEREGDFPLWYIIHCGLNSQYNALELANIFYESEAFAVSEPEFINANYTDCVNDPKFNKQWNLKNTGQGFMWTSLVDINYCDAHSITAGNSAVTIAVYDRGVELTHPDLNIHSFSYDANTESSPSTIYYDKNNNLHYHATACAGIIGAKTNNSMGVAGIAPNCPIMSISFDSLCSSQKIGEGFKVAANNGCSVISNSWSCGVYSHYINEGISYALSNGRNGRGCVVVFSAGNENTNSINYPANSNDSIIVVGAMSPCGERKNPYSCDYENWGSNFGLKLDVMAPGVEIPTTDLVGTVGNDTSNYMLNFNGTSSACPHVAAVAGLILSVNPFLTQKEVADIIESTAQKVGSYSYTTHSGRPNGTWNDSVGHGLVDAYSAVTEAQNRYPKIQGPDYICYGDTVCFTFPDMPNEITYNWTLSTPTALYGTYRIVQGQGSSSICVTHTDPYTPQRATNSGQDSSIGDGEISSPSLLQENTVRVTITTADNRTYTFTKSFHEPKGQIPTINASNTSTLWLSGSTRFFTITNNTSAPAESLHWEIMDVLFDPVNGNDTTIQYLAGKTISYTPYVQPTYLKRVTVSVTNTFEACEEQSSSMSFGVTNRLIHLNATKNNSILYISLLEESTDGQRFPAQLGQNNNYSLELWHNIYGLQMTQVVYSTSELMNIADLPGGVYVLLLKENSNVIAEAKVQI